MVIVYPLLMLLLLFKAAAEDLRSQSIPLYCPILIWLLKIAILLQKSAFGALAPRLLLRLTFSLMVVLFLALLEWRWHIFVIGSGDLLMLMSLHPEAAPAEILSYAGCIMACTWPFLLAYTVTQHFFPQHLQAPRSLQFPLIPFYIPALIIERLL